MYFLIIIITVIIDQVSKIFVVSKLKDVESFPIFNDILQITYHENRGAFLGMLANNRWIFMSLSTIAVIAMIIFLFVKRKESPLLLTSIALLASGGIGNMIDRIRLGYVIDFIYVKLIDFPIFNIADSCVTIGAGIMIIYVIKTEFLAKKNKTTLIKDNTDD